MIIDGFLWLFVWIGPRSDLITLPIKRLFVAIIFFKKQGHYLVEYPTLDFANCNLSFH